MRSRHVVAALYLRWMLSKANRMKGYGSNTSRKSSNFLHKQFYSHNTKKSQNRDECNVKQERAEE